ncbi:GNAT family N-acetyltransferase [Lederbergia wuyishanensis]|uniref:GNAT superfamily N-acetyltransferase n=1 Tax=Lederbergia wuyishanensis TaxID=1347903 RepID=A0ABU0CYT8_9BACI|nr:GNAT family N-acetyltransferase [Lederbergia wuyishanensis]MCJ8005943.1 GNAT family N-acetyltransferase [Lederbergia wuyishanensis]MDQ0341308.1 GNAT superfamily N-acetyltransferase [Lederbergia wuyishanensis]
MDFYKKEITLEELESCAKLYTYVFNQAPWFDQWTLQSANERLIDILNHLQFWGVGIYDHNHQLLGFLMGYSETWWDGKHFQVVEMCVKTEEQGKGIGSNLIHSLEDHCKENGIKRIYLLTGSGGLAEEFYIKNGFYVNPRMIMMSKMI